MRRYPLSSLIFVALAAASFPAPGQEAGAGGEEPGSIFFEALDVKVVNVEVFVTDRQGQPVRGLKAGDFELREDGRPVEITNFYAVERGRPRAARSPTTSASISSSTSTISTSDPSAATA